jgi:membrane protease subunit (stomatin/prohibitin family)
MGLFDFIKKQFIDVIEWPDAPDGVLAYRYPMQDQEIQNGATLTVRDGQLALFVNEGVVADQFGPGNYTLSTRTLPVLTNLKNWDKLFDSPFKSDVVFFSTRLQLEQKWGTPTPITLRDNDFGMVRLRAFGQYSYSLADPMLFYKEVSGARDAYTVAELDGQLRGNIMTAISQALGSSGIPFIDMAANQEGLSATMLAAMQPCFARYGLKLDGFVVQNLSLPEELQAMLDKRISANMAGDMQRYTQFQVAESIPLAAAQGGGGLAGVGAEMAVGLGMGQVMAGNMMQALQPAAATPAPVTPAAAAVPAEDPLVLLEKLHGLMEKGILTPEEFAAKKADLLQRLG